MVDSFGGNAADDSSLQYKQDDYHETKYGKRLYRNWEWFVF